MKRILSIIITLILVGTLALGFMPVSASDYTDFLKNIGIVPQSFGVHNAEQNVTRGEFAYMVAGIITGMETEKCETRFSDVTEKDECSGQVEFLANLGIVNGYGDGTFGKNDSMKLETAYIILMRALGYESFMKQSENISGYTELASIVGLDVNGHTNQEGYVTKGGAVEIVYDTLTASLAEVSYIYGKNENLLSIIADSDRGILAENFKVSAYRGIVSDVDVKKHCIEFTVSKNLYKNNPIMLNTGVKVECQAKENLNIYEYNQTPATIWVNEDNELVHIIMDKDVSVKYVNIISVNGDKENNAYRTDYISRMTFLDDEEEYDVNEDATYKYNGKAFSGQISLCGKYARVVMKDNEITHIESWDLEEGGLITEIGTTDIRYIKGAQNLIIKGLNNYDTSMYFIEGRYATASELKTDSLFYYYSSEDYIAIVVSEKVITDKLISKSEKTIEIGSSILNCNDTMYYMDDMGKYEKVTSSDSILTLFDKIVRTYVAHNGKVLYIKPDDGRVITSSFYAAVIGVEEDTMAENEGEIELLFLEQDFATKRFKLTEKTKYNDSLSMIELSKTARDLTGKGIYEFKVSEKGNVTSVSKPEAFYGYGTDTVSVNITSFSTLSGTANVKIGSNPIYFTGVPIIALYSENGKMIAKKLEWSALTSRYVPSGATMTFYGKGKTPTPTLVVLTGAVNEIGGTKIVGGVIVDKHLAINELGDNVVNLVVATPLGKKEYTVSPEFAEKYKIHTFIRYIEDMVMSENEIYIRKTMDVSKTHDMWVDNDADMKMQKGIVDMVDSQRVYFDDGTAIFMHPSNFQIMCVDESNPNPNKRFDTYSVDYLTKGDTIFYEKDSEGIKFILAVK